jgi:hypothetical protein
MKPLRTTTYGALVGAVLLGGITAPAVHASPDDVAINGTYTATSDGQWAKTNMRYHDEASVTSTWTFTTTCVSFLSCTGTVTSDQGWIGNARFMSGQWLVTHTVPDWERCDDGTASPGEQQFSFWPDRKAPPNLKGWDKTIGVSGACGINKWLTVEMPFNLIPVG